MVEVRTPTANYKGQIFTPLSNQFQKPNPNPNFSMDQFPPASASSRKVRLNKHRKNLPRGKATNLNKNSLEKVEEKISSWNPFVSVNSNLNANSNANDIAFGFGATNFNGGAFVFGSNQSLGRESSNFDANAGAFASGENDSLSQESAFASGENDSLSQESSLGSDEGLMFTKISEEMKGMNLKDSNSEERLFSMLPEEMRKMNLKSSGNVDGGFEKDNRGGSGSMFVGNMNSSKPINVASGNSEKPTARYASFGGEGSGNFDSGVFVFGSKAKNNDGLSRNSSTGADESLFSKLPDEMRKLNLKNASYVAESKPINVGPSSFGSETSGSRVFEFESGVNNTADLSKNSSIGSDESMISKLPDEMRKMNLKNTSNISDFEKNKQAENTFDFGPYPNSSKPINVGSEKPTTRSASFCSEGSGDSNPIGFVFGNGVNTSANLSQNSSIGSGESLFSNLPDEMRKMNLKTHGNEDDFDKKKQAENSFVFRSSTNSTNFESVPFTNGVWGSKPKPTVVLGSERSGKSDSDNSAFKRGIKENVDYSKNSSLGSDEGLFSKLPDEIKRMNLSTEDDFEKSKGGNNFYIFGGKMEATGVFSNSGANTAQKETEKFDVGIDTPSQNLKNESIRSAGGAFLFEVDKEMDQNDKIDENDGFDFGASSFNPLNENMEKLGIGSNRENSTGSVPLKFDMGAIPSSPMFSFMGKSPNMEFKTPLTKETLFTGTHQKTAFSSKKSDAKSTKMKKKKDKSRQSAPLYQNFSTQLVSENSGAQANIDVDSNGGFSPMDCSPYHEDLTADQYSRETSVASEDAQQKLGFSDETEAQVSEAQRLNISEESASIGEQINKDENMGLDNNARNSMERQPSEDIGESNFKFTASPFTQNPLLAAAKPNYRRKNRLKPSQNSSVSATNARVSYNSQSPDLIPCISTLLDSVGQKINLSAPQSKDENNRGKSKEPEAGQEDEKNRGKSKEPEAGQESTRSGNPCVAAEELCEKWRFRGNQAYANGHLSKAEDYYTRGVTCVSLKEIPSSCVRPLTLCYSNRAATRMSIGKIREALSDCKMAVSMDPTFIKARVRAANCHLSLGEIGEALKHFKKCLQSENSISSDQKYLNEASDGLQKAQQVTDFTGQSAELLLRRTSNDASKALNMICEALSISPHSERLLEMKAEALLLMRSYEEAIKLCEQTLDLAEKNSDSQFENFSSPAKLWRSHIIAKSYFYLGKLEEALELLEKHEKANPTADKTIESLTSFVATIRELLQLKSAGNESFQAARHSEAVEYYTSALTCNAESRPFTAVCFCNRAAAFQALGQITDAIADCSLAIALDSSYAKAISRRATLHEMIRDYGQAANDLNRLISLFQKQIKEMDPESRGTGKSSSILTELKRAQSRLVTVEEEGRKGISLNMYMILGIEQSSSAADIKKAYRKAALRHHPDKAGQSLVRNDNIDDGLWREVAAEVHTDADRLFKMIGEAYTTLSDPSKRLQYDEEEEMRTYPVRGYNVSSPRTSSDVYGNYYHEKSFQQRQWRQHGSSYQRW